MKRQYKKAGKCAAHCSPFELNKASRESKRDTVLFRKIIHITTSKFVYGLEKCKDKDKKFKGKLEEVVFLKIIRLVQVKWSKISIVLSVTKISIVIGPLRASLSRNRRAQSVYVGVQFFSYNVTQ